MVKTMVSTLTGVALDWAVAKAAGALEPLGNVHPVGKQLFIAINGDLGEPGEWVRYAPSQDWSQGGVIIEGELISPLYPPATETSWRATKKGTGNLQYGPTPLIAAMRCYVASKFGSTIEVPEELK